MSQLCPAQSLAPGMAPTRRCWILHQHEEAKQHGAFSTCWLVTSAEPVCVRVPEPQSAPAPPSRTSVLAGCLLAELAAAGLAGLQGSWGAGPAAGGGVKLREGAWLSGCMWDVVLRWARQLGLKARVRLWWRSCLEASSAAPQTWLSWEA